MHSQSGTWYEKIRGRVPDSPIVRDLIESVEQLPGLEHWSPPRGIENHGSELLRWGFALWMSRSLDAASLQKALAAEILVSDRPAPETFAELSSAGLCVALGAIA